MTVTTDRSPPARNAARRRRAQPIPAAGCVGIVTALDDDRFVIASGNATLRGRRAVSCLIEPCIGDTVNCVTVAPDEVWILDILMREAGGAHTLSLDGDTTLAVREGALTLQARALNLHSETCNVQSQRLEASLDEAEVVGRQFRLIGSGVKLVATLVDTVAERIMQFSQQYQRSTLGTDRVQAQVIDRDAQQLLTQSAEHVMLNGRRLIKARGGQIHFG